MDSKRSPGQTPLACGPCFPPSSVPLPVTDRTSALPWVFSPMVVSAWKDLTGKYLRCSAA